jgi:ABC-2 type transport system permease protein
LTTSDTATSRQAVPPAAHRSTPLFLRSIGLKTLRDQRQSLFWWIIGTFVLSAIMIMLYPQIDGGAELEALFEQMPAPIQAMIGEEIDLSTAAGYLDLRMFATIAPLLFLVYSIGRGNAAVAGEESRGTLDLLLAHPVRRWRIIIEHTLAIGAGLIVISIAMWGGLVVGGILVDETFDWTAAALAILMSGLLGMVFGTLALALGSQTGRPGIAIGVSAAVGIAMFFLHSLAPLVDWLEPARLISPFYYAVGHSVMLDGFNIPYALVLAGISIALTILATVAFSRRDIAI